MYQGKDDPKALFKNKYKNPFFNANVRDEINDDTMAWLSSLHESVATTKARLSNKFSVIKQEGSIIGLTQQQLTDDALLLTPVVFFSVLAILSIFFIVPCVFCSCCSCPIGPRSIRLHRSELPPPTKKAKCSLLVG